MGELNRGSSKVKSTVSQKPKYARVKKPDGKILLVTFDYYKENGIRTPVGLSKAFEIANKEGMRLPTPEEVDLIWQQADIRLDPIPMPPTAEMTSQLYWEEHDRRINNQLQDLGYTDWSHKLIAGHKKDIVSIHRTSKKVAIYGWHGADGRPIQPRSTVHHREYFDYSHGLRLVKDED